MIADIVAPGTEDRSVRIRFIESSGGSNPGDPVTVDHATSGLALWYRREGGVKVAVSPAALAALNTAHTDGGVEPISDGYSRVDLPDAAFAAGADYVEFGGSATNIIGIGGTVRLDYPASTLKDLLEADAVLDKTTDANAWRLHIYRKGTTTDLVPPKLLYDADGAAVDAATTPVASQKE